ncbi:MAG: aminopeptidase [Clostridia bacterium]|nr:aminopeptidase [Clostridia bacterium]
MDKKTKMEKTEKKYGWKGADSKMKKKIMKFCDGYIDFLNAAKTEREAAIEIVRIAREAGFKDIKEVESLVPGSRVYSVNRSKSVYMAVVGEDVLTEGFNLVGAHIDSPRLDLKQNPLYEDGNMALLKTHYYGGIKKYQWTTIPLALHGVVAKADGSVATVNIGEDEKDPVFLVTDLLPHLSAKQNAKKLAEGVPAENLNIVIGSIPSESAEEENIKSTVLELLAEKYAMKEEDFKSAELEAVPAAKARSLGIDGGMIAGYGQDDRVCAYPELMAMTEMAKKGIPKRTSLAIFADKEEIGSMGNTGMSSHNFELFLMELLEKSGIVHPYALQRTLSHARALSADVTAAFDPTYAEVMEKNNASWVGKGVNIKKYTGTRGKSGASDANAEYVGFVRGIFEKAGIVYQSSEMGKVDEGGGGTIAYILADRGMEVLDCGVPVHSMHSPYESASKYDIYMAYLAYTAFYESF